MPTRSSAATQTTRSSSPIARYDVVVVGGGLAGGAFATLMRRRRPTSSVLVVERSETFHRKVGEATVEVSGHFLHRVLGLYDHLSREHLPKHGLRYWFNDGQKRPLEELTEVGPSELPHLPSFQLHRPKLDAHLLDVARAEGAEVARPAKITGFEQGRPWNRLVIEDRDGERTIEARWIIDASGRQAFLARKLGIHRKVEEHPTAAFWARWRGAQDLDSFARSGDARAPRLPPIAASRRLATNHFCGYGWWSWVIPLADGGTSIGVVWNKDLYDPPGDGSLRERYEAFVRSTPGLSELVDGAEIDGDDFMALSHLPYTTDRYLGDGWAMVGDSASFLDPYYSPGLDHAAISIWATVDLVDGALDGRLEGRSLARRIERHNADFARSYSRWLEALYLGKYCLFGDALLTRCAFLVDTALYYLGVVTPIVRQIGAMGNPIFGLGIPQATVAWRLATAFNRRLQTLACHRLASGRYGRQNVGRRMPSKAFSLGVRGSLGPLRAGLAAWLRLEAENLMDRLLRRVESAPPRRIPSET